MLSENILIKIIKHGIYAILFLPAIVIPGFFFPFTTSKAFLFQIIIEIIFVLYTVLAFYRPTFRPKKTLLFWTLAFYFVALFFSTIFSVDIYQSFFGNYERMWGYFQLFHFFLFFTLLIGIFKSREDWRRLMNVALCAGMFVVASGIIQFFGFIFFEDNVKRIFGMIGNPAFLASYLFFIFIFLLQKSYVKSSRYRYVIFTALCFFVMLSTGTRGIFVALGAISVVAALLCIFFLKAFNLEKGEQKDILPQLQFQKKLKIISVVFLILISIGIFSVLQYGSLFKKSQDISQEEFYTISHIDKLKSKKKNSKLSFLKRFTDFSLYDTTTQTRLITWKSSIMSFTQNPIFGIGPENFVLTFNEHFNSEFYTYERKEVWFDRAHNIFIDALIMYGIIGLGAYLSIFIAVFYVLFSLYKKQKIDFSYFCVFILFFVGYLVQNFFLFDSFSVFLVFMLALAYLNSFISIPVTKLVIKDKLSSNSIPYSLTLIIPLLLVLIVSYLFNIKPILANIALAKAESGKYNIDVSVNLYKKALSYETFGDNEIRGRFALAVAKEVQGQKNEVLLSDTLNAHLDNAIVALKQNITQSDSRHLIYRLQLSDLYNLSLSRSGEVSEEIEDIIVQSLKLSTGRMEFDFALAQSEFLKGNFKKAVNILIKSSLKNKNHSLPYWKIAQMYQSMGQDDNAIVYLEKALYFGHGTNNPLDLLWAEQYYVEKEDYVKIVFIDKILLNLYGEVKESARIHQNLALAYANLGKVQKAKTHAYMVGILDTSQKALVDNFLEQLEKSR